MKIRFTTKQIVFLICALILFDTIYLATRSKISTLLKDEKIINFLIVGTDYVDYSYHADTIILVTYNPKTRLIDIVSIPRDTKISLPDIPVKKINEIYTYQYRHKKNHLQAIYSMSGVIRNILLNRLQIHGYFQIDYEIFKQIVNALKGITIEIEEPMHYVDKAGKLYIDFRPGLQTLNGQKALEYVRYRTTAGDVGRIYRQHRFLRAIINKFQSQKIIFYVPALLKILTNYPSTNLNLWDLTVLLLELKNVNFENARISQLPGKYHGTLWIPDEYEIQYMLNLILGPEKEIFENRKILVEVLNASGKTALAKKVARKLRTYGFDVIDYRTSPTKQVKTIIVDRTGNLKATQLIAKILNTNEIFTRYNSKGYVDISVYIGENYEPNYQEENKQKWLEW